jgi:DNA-binding transcriptional MerR regulator
MSRTLPPDVADQRRDLYERGFNDAVIAARVGVSKNAIRFWRLRQGLPRRRDPGGGPQISSNQEDRRYELHRAGCTDPEIAMDQDVSPRAIAFWRKRRNLKPNYKERSP